MHTEIQAHAHLSQASHPHIAPLLLVLEDEASGRTHLVMQWAEDGDVRKHLSRSGAARSRPSEQRLVDFLVRPLLQALTVLAQQVCAMLVLHA